VMNTFGNLGSAVSPILLAYMVGLYGWNVPFLVCSFLCIAGAILSMGIEADRKIAAEPVVMLSYDQSTETADSYEDKP
jgi:MFS family permease